MLAITSGPLGNAWVGMAPKVGAAQIGTFDSSCWAPWRRKEGSRDLDANRN